MFKKAVLVSVLLVAGVVAQGENPKKYDATTHATNKKAETKVVCPVMHKEILPSEAVATQSYNGKVYYLCCGYCKQEFKKDPGKYVK